MKKKLQNRIDRLYSRIANEEDTSASWDISDEAGKSISSNFFLLIISNTFAKLGDAMSSPKTVLAWLMGFVNAPVYLISFLVPIRESGSMLPQIFIAGIIRKLSVRKWVWVFGSIFQFFAIAGIGVVCLLFDGTIAGLLIIVLLVFFSLARGLCSVASKDVIGKTIPKTKRGKLNGFSTSLSGFLVLVLGLLMISMSKLNPGIEFYAVIIFSAAFLWIIGAIVYARIKESPGETSAGGNTIKEAIKKLSLLRNDKPFRNFVIARALLLCSALTAPFYVIIAQDILGKDIKILGLFILSNGIASSLSAPFWGKMADLSSRKVMVKAGLIAASLGLLMFCIISWMPIFREMKWIYPLAFFILGVAHSGVRLGRKTYIIDMAGGNKRTDYVAVSNTIIGAVLLITGGVSAVASFISSQGIILILSIFGVLGAITSSRLPEVE